MQSTVNATHISVSLDICSVLVLHTFFYDEMCRRIDLLAFIVPLEEAPTHFEQHRVFSLPALKIKSEPCAYFRYPVGSYALEIHATTSEPIVRES